jgi:hypothetical protein
VELFFKTITDFIFVYIKILVNFIKKMFKMNMLEFKVNIIFGLFVHFILYTYLNYEIVN